MCNSFPAFLSTWMKLTQAAEKASIVLTQLGKFTLSAQGSEWPCPQVMHVRWVQKWTCSLSPAFEAWEISTLTGAGGNMRLLAPLGGIWETSLLFSRIVWCDAWNHRVRHDFFVTMRETPSAKRQKASRSSVISIPRLSKSDSQHCFKTRLSQHLYHREFWWMQPLTAATSEQKS